MDFSLKRVLKRKNIKLKDFQQALREKYNYSVCIATISGYCSKESPSPYPCWKVILKCLKEQYGIVYENGMWKEVMNNGR